LGWSTYVGYLGKEWELRLHDKQVARRHRGDNRSLAGPRLPPWPLWSHSHTVLRLVGGDEYILANSQQLSEE